MISATFFQRDSGGHTWDSDMNYQLAKKGNNIKTHFENQKYLNHKISVVIALALVIALSYFCDCLNLKCDCNICVCCVCTCTCNTQLFLCILAFHTHVKLREQTFGKSPSMMKRLRKLIISVYIRMGRIWDFCKQWQRHPRSFSNWGLSAYAALFANVKSEYVLLWYWTINVWTLTE